MVQDLQQQFLETVYQPSLEWANCGRCSTEAPTERDQIRRKLSMGDAKVSVSVIFRGVAALVLYCQEMIHTWKRCSKSGNRLLLDESGVIILDT